MFPKEVLDEKKAESQLLLASDVSTLEKASELINLFHDNLTFHEQTYYIDAEQIISDLEYDLIFKKLEKIEKDFPSLIDIDSPTQRVGKGLTKDFPQKKHIIPMLSLENSYNEADLLDFERKIKDSTNIETVKYLVEPKFDGSSISLVYENDRLISGITRGDGLVGEDITNNIRVLKNIPLKTSFSKYGIQTIEIRGEILIKKEFFKNYNQKRLENNLPPLANPRNSAAGALRLQDPVEVGNRGLEGMMYHISYCVDKEGNNLLKSTFNSRHQNVEFLKKMGFTSPFAEGKVCNNVDEIFAHIHEWEAKRDGYKYELDGMVIKVDDIQLEEQLGTTSHHPKWAMAYKFSARQAITILESVDFQVGRVGTITPVAKLKPVQVGGVTVSSITMFNEEFIQEKDIKIGDHVIVERAGDVIPYIHSVVKEERTGKENTIEFPKICPRCETELIRIQGEAAWKCPNFKCPAQVEERLIHFASRDAMEITGLGDAIVRKFFEQNILNNISDIYKLDYETVSKVEGFGKKSASNMIENIQGSKNKTLNKLIFGLGIPLVGENTSKTLAGAVEDIFEFQNFTIEQLMSLKDIGPKVAKSVFEFFQDEVNISLLNELSDFGLNLKNPKTGSSSSLTTKKLAGLTFLFTGTMENMGRKEASELVESLGGIIAGSLSAKVNYLVVGEDAGSKLAKAQKMESVKILNEEEFITFINK